MKDVDWTVNLLRRSLQRLAAKADEQLRYLTLLSPIVDVDELALELGDVYPVLPQLQSAGLVSSGGAHAIEDLHDQLDRMSGMQHRELWTEDALRSSAEWRAVRILAQRALDRW